MKIGVSDHIGNKARKRWIDKILSIIHSQKSYQNTQFILNLICKLRIGEDAYGQAFIK